jgi:VanZ family protein
MSAAATRRVGLAVSVMTFVAILVMTLTPTGSQITAGFWCMTCGELAGLDVTNNIVMFAPFGFALALAMNRRWRPLAICVATTVLIETLQIRVVPGRDASFRDILTNSLGGLLGVELALRRTMLLWPGPRTAARLALVWCSLFAGICTLTTWALGPAFVPRSLWVQWLPPRANYEPFTGRLLAFDIDGIDLPLGFPKASLGLDRRLMSDAWHATVTIDRDRLEPRRSVVVRISEESTQPFALEQRAWDLTCLQKTRSAELRFRSPRVALPDALQLTTGAHPDIVRLTCTHRDRALLAGVRAGSESREEAVPLSPSLGWTMISPFDIALDAGTRWISMLWLIALLVPVGYWWAAAVEPSSRSLPGRAPSLRIGAAVLAAVALGFVVAPLAAGTAFASWWEWVAALGGVTGGFVFSRVLRRVLAMVPDPATPTRTAFAQR